MTSKLWELIWILIVVLQWPILRLWLINTIVHSVTLSLIGDKILIAEKYSISINTVLCKKCAFSQVTFDFTMQILSKMHYAYNNCIIPTLLDIQALHFQKEKKIKIVCQ